MVMTRKLRRISYDDYILEHLDVWIDNPDLDTFYIASILNRNPFQVPDKLWADLFINHLNNLYN